MRSSILLISWALCMLMSWQVQGQDEKPSSKKEKALEIPKLHSFITHHKGVFGNKSISYSVRAEETFLTNKEEEKTATIWSVSYIREEVNTPSSRPVTFIFNGGPGSASIWLHMGLLGPKLVQVPKEAEEDDGAAPYPILHNTNCLLDITDLVFVDPVGTGYSRVVGKGKNENYWGLNEDTRSMAQFIRTWVTKNNRWNAPKYIAGESFGTTRAAAVANELMGGGQDLALNGLIMISQALDYSGSTSVHDNITSYLTYLPYMAATAWYHKKAGQDLTLKQFIERARQFTYDEYAPALYRGNRLDSISRTEIVSKLSYFTGLDSDYISRSNIRVLIPRFQKELLRDKGLTLGRLDGRYTGMEDDQVAVSPTLGDASSYSISSAYTAALHQYFSESLQVQMNRPYLTSNRDINAKWNWKPVAKDSGWEPSYVNTARKLSRAMRKNKDLKVLVACGYYDLITPFFDAEFTFSRNGIPTKNVTLKYYEGGHMMYTHGDDLQKLMSDIRTFIEN